MLSEQLGDLEQCKVRKEKALVSSVQLFPSVERNETKRNETTIYQDRLGKNIKRDTHHTKTLFALSLIRRPA